MSNEQVKNFQTGETQCKAMKEHLFSLAREFFGWRIIIFEQNIYTPQPVT